MSDPKLCIAITANHDCMARDYMMTIMNLIKPCDCIVSLKGAHIKSASLNEHLVEAANRNCTHILFLDVDMQFPPSTIPRLLSHKEPVVGGLYHLKSTPFSPITGWTDQEGTAVNGRGEPWKYDYYPLPKNQLVEVDWCGIGCLMVDMDVFNKIYFPPFRDVWNEELGKRQKGHDVLFCEEARKVGYKVHVDTCVDCTHVGRMYVNSAWVETYHRLNMDGELLNTVRDFSTDPSWWDDIWEMAKEHHRERNQRALLDVISPLIPYGASVVDFGCGDGQLLRLLERNRGCDVYGYDFSQGSIECLEAKGIPGEVADIRYFSPNGRKYHTVVFSHVLEHMTDEFEDRAVGVIRDMADHQAFVIVPQEHRLHYEHQRLYDEERLRQVLERHFVEVEIIKIPGSPGTAYDYRHLIGRCYASTSSDNATS